MAVQLLVREATGLLLPLQQLAAGRPQDVTSAATLSKDDSLLWPAALNGSIRNASLAMLVALVLRLLRSAPSLNLRGLLVSSESAAVLRERS